MPSQKHSPARGRILAAAIKLFADFGYHETSTREIARLAEVSENTLFRQFSRKEEIFWSALRSRCPVVSLGQDLAEGMTSCGAPEVILPKIIEHFSGILNDTPELPRLVAVAFLELRWNADAFCEECISPAFHAISQYLALNVQTGKVRNCDPIMVTVALMTMVLVHPWFSHHVQENRTAFADSREAGIAYTTFWLDVLRPAAMLHGEQAAPIQTDRLPMSANP